MFASFGVKPLKKMILVYVLYLSFDCQERRSNGNQSCVTSPN